MRAKPKNEPLADRRRLLPQTSGARQAPRYAKDPQNDATALKTKSKPQFDSLRGGLQSSGSGQRHCCSKEIKRLVRDHALRAG